MVSTKHPGNTFTMSPLGRLRVQKVYEVYTGKPLAFKGDSAITICDIGRASSPADSVVAVVYDQPIQSLWKK